MVEVTPNNEQPLKWAIPFTSTKSTIRQIIHIFWHSICWYWCDVFLALLCKEMTHGIRICSEVRLVYNISKVDGTMG